MSSLGENYSDLFMRAREMRLNSTPLRSKGKIVYALDHEKRHLLTEFKAKWLAFTGPLLDELNKLYGKFGIGPLDEVRLDNMVFLYHEYKGTRSDVFRDFALIIAGDADASFLNIHEVLYALLNFE